MGSWLIAFTYKHYLFVVGSKMDLLRRMQERRKEVGAVDDPKPQGEKKKSKTQRAKQFPPGSRQMRNFIIEEKPPKKVVMDHITALAEELCKEDSD